MLKKLTLILLTVLFSISAWSQELSSKEEITPNEMVGLDQFVECMEVALADVQYFLDTWYHFASKYDPESGIEPEEALMASLTDAQLQEYQRQSQLIEEVLDDEDLDNCLDQKMDEMQELGDGFETGRLPIYLAYIKSKGAMNTYSFLQMIEFVDLL